VILPAWIWIWHSADEDHLVRIDASHTRNEWYRLKNKRKEHVRDEISKILKETTKWYTSLKKINGMTKF
jgi:hypothetical protein